MIRSKPFKARVGPVSVHSEAQAATGGEPAPGSTASDSEPGRWVTNHGHGAALPGTWPVSSLSPSPSPTRIHESRPGEPDSESSRGPPKGAVTPCQ